MLLLTRVHVCNPSTPTDCRVSFKEVYPRHLPSPNCNKMRLKREMLERFHSFTTRSILIFYLRSAASCTGDAPDILSGGHSANLAPSYKSPLYFTHHDRPLQPDMRTLVYLRILIKVPKVHKTVNHNGLRTRASSPHTYLQCHIRRKVLQVRTRPFWAINWTGVRRDSTGLTTVLFYLGTIFLSM